MRAVPERPNLVDFDMSDLCFEVAGRYDALCDKITGSLICRPTSPCPVSADPAMMERVMHNLLGNAFHHIGADRYRCAAGHPAGEKGCRIEIEDHGPGIPPEDLLIFDPLLSCAAGQRAYRHRLGPVHHEGNFAAARLCLRR